MASFSASRQALLTKHGMAYSQPPVYRGLLFLPHSLLRPQVPWEVGHIMIKLRKTLQHPLMCQGFTQEEGKLHLDVDSKTAIPLTLSSCFLLTAQEKCQEGEQGGFNGGHLFTRFNCKNVRETEPLYRLLCIWIRVHCLFSTELYYYHSHPLNWKTIRNEPYTFACIIKQIYDIRLLM